MEFSKIPIPVLITLGIDEAGRGPWAGPICAAGVLVENEDNLPKEIRDSKTIQEREREELATWIKTNLRFSISTISATEIDTLGLAWANTEIFQRVINELACSFPNEFLLCQSIKIDGTKKKVITEKSLEFLTKGESKSKAIAAASILAKTHRDELLKKLGENHPLYGFETHKGYGTKKHQTALEKYGIIKGVHRISFAPIKKLQENTTVKPIQSIIVN